MQTERLNNTTKSIAHAATLLRKGKTVAFPTETVYGLGADATNGTAVAGVYEAKGRPSFNPLIVHLASVSAAQRLVEWNDMADRLAATFWPGPLTLVLPLRAGSGISELVTAGLNTLAIRLPAHPVAQALLKAADRPLAAPSANLSGKITSVTANHVLHGLDGRIAAVLDGGPCSVGLESTILGLVDAPTLLRPGGVPREPLETALGQPLALPQTDDGITAPGQLSSHYAPRASVRLNAEIARGDEFLVGFGKVAGDITLSAAGDLREAAARLFGVLHEADAAGRPIAIAPVPHVGLGVAINDRLRRAAAPRAPSD